jgi:positive regulator of sigma E activity
MASEALTVIDTDADTLHVSTRQQSWCKNCHAQPGCGMQLLHSASFNKQETLEFPMPVSLQGKVAKGDSVEFIMQDRQLMLLAFQHYLLPLICMLVATLLATAITDALNIGEFPVILSAFSGLFLSLFWVRQLSKLHTGIPARIVLSSIRKSSSMEN